MPTQFAHIPGRLSVYTVQKICPSFLASISIISIVYGKKVEPVSLWRLCCLLVTQKWSQ